MNRPYEVFDRKWTRKYYEDRKKRRRSRYKYNRDVEGEDWCEYMKNAELEWVQQLSDDVLAELLDHEVMGEAWIEELTSEKVPEAQRDKRNRGFDHFDTLLKLKLRLYEEREAIKAKWGVSLGEPPFEVARNIRRLKRPIVIVGD